MRSQYALFQSHLDLAHHYWTQLLSPGDIAVDATCGKGYDTLKLCQLALASHLGQVYAFDLQEAAIEQTRNCAASSLTAQQMSRLHLEKRCHSQFPSELTPHSVKLIVYNLGYLPGGDKGVTTQTSTTLQSLQRAQELIMPGGAISLTCYPGHVEGAQEEKAILDYTQTLSPLTWSCCHHRWLNRHRSPSLLFLQRANANP